MCCCPPPWTTPLGCLVQVATGASLQVSLPCVRLGCLASCLACCSALFLLFVHPVASKAVALCGVVYPLHHCVCVVGVLCFSSLRSSSVMIQDPLWASVKALEYPLWFSRALSPPVLCCLPALLSAFLCVGVSWCLCFRPAPAAVWVSLVGWLLCFLAWFCWLCVGVVV